MIAIGVTLVFGSICMAFGVMLGRRLGEESAEARLRTARRIEQEYRS